MTLEELMKLLKAPVFDESGRRLGLLERIYADSKKKVAKKAVIRFDNGKRKKVSADQLFYASGAVVYSRKGVIKGKPLFADSEPDLAQAKEILDKMKVIKERMLKLDELLVEGKITETTFKILRGDYEAQLKSLQEMGMKYFEKLKKRLMELESREEKLSEELNLIEARMYVGEISENEYQKKAGPIKLELDRIRGQIKVIREFLQECTSDVIIGLPEKVKVEKGDISVARPRSAEGRQEFEVKVIEEDEDEEGRVKL